MYVGEGEQIIFVKPGTLLKDPYDIFISVVVDTPLQFANVKITLIRLYRETRVVDGFVVMYVL